MFLNKYSRFVNEIKFKKIVVRFVIIIPTKKVHFKIFTISAYVVFVLFIGCQVLEKYILTI